MLNYVAMQVVTFAIVFWENPKGSNTVGIINAAGQKGWFPSIFGQKYGLNVIDCSDHHTRHVYLSEIQQTGI